MDPTCEDYYKLNQFLLTIIGLWPYNDSVFRYIQRIFFILLLSFSISLQFGKIILSVSDLESLIQILSFALPCLVFSLKYATFYIKFQDIKKLTEQIKCHWNVINCKKEIEMLHQYSVIARLVIIVATTLLYSSIATFLISQIMPKFLDIVAPLNESRPFKLLGVATIFFDQEKYFVPIYIHMIVALFIESTTIMATESMCLTFIQHACVLFKIASFRIQHAFDCKMQVSASERYKIYYTNLVDAVIIHNTAIEYFESVNSCFEISYFILLVIGVCSLSINLFRLCQAGLKRDVDELAVSFLIVSVHFSYMFMSNVVAQIVTNHSIDIYYKACNLSWYSIPVRLQKLFHFIIQRSQKNCRFTMTSMFDASLECFASLMSLSLSYFTVIWSIQ